MPPGLFSVPAARAGKVVYAPEIVVKQLPTLPGQSECYDVKEWVESQGIRVPHGGKAIYTVADQRLTLTTFEDDLDMMDVVTSNDRSTPLLAEITFTVADFDAPLDSVFPQRKMAYAELKQQSIASWRIDKSLTFVTKSGQAVTAEALHHSSEKSGKGQPKQPAKRGDPAEIPPFAVNESGLRVEIEPVIGPDSQTVDLILKCRCRPDRQSDGALDDFSLSTGVILATAEPIVVQISKIPAAHEAQAAVKSSHFRAVIVSARVLDARGQPYKDEAATPKTEVPPVKSESAGTK